MLAVSIFKSFLLYISFDNVVGMNYNIELSTRLYEIDSIVKKQRKNNFSSLTIICKSDK